MLIPYISYKAPRPCRPPTGRKNNVVLNVNVPAAGFKKKPCCVKCWACGKIGHIARFCRSRYRRSVPMIKKKKIVDKETQTEPSAEVFQEKLPATFVDVVGAKDLPQAFVKQNMLNLMDCLQICVQGGRELPPNIMALGQILEEMIDEY